MVPSRAPSAQLLRSLRILELSSTSNGQSRTFVTSYAQYEEAQKESFYQNPKPETVFAPRLERRLMRAGNPPIGSRRRRMALAQSQRVPFDQLPFQCFQEARKILIADRTEKLEKIEMMRKRIARVSDQDGTAYPGGEAFRQKKLKSMKMELEHLKILADSNDPNVKRRFEDGKGDMTKPIYRHLAKRKWEEYRRKVQVQRITQLNVVPDVVPFCQSSVDIQMSFNGRSVGPGDFVDSATSEQPCSLKIQTFDSERKLLTIAVIDPDIPNFHKDNFDTRCHFLASNIEVTSTTPSLSLSNLSQQDQVLIPWRAPTAQRGSPYHRLAIVILQQKDNIPINIETASRHAKPETVQIRSLMTRHLLTPIGATLFRTKWDESMAAVMQRIGEPGHDMELKRIKVQPLPYKRRNPKTFR